MRSPGRKTRDAVIVDAESSSSGVKSAERVLAILEYLATNREATFSSITRDLALPNSSAHELLRTMARRRFIELDPINRRFCLGIRAWEIAQGYTAASNLVVLARPLMQELTARTLETVQLACLDGLENVYLAISESPHPMKLVSKPGGRLPAHATGLGKVLLASLPEDELARRLDGVELARFTERTIVDVEALGLELVRIRARGFGEDNEEYVVGCRCIAMPIRGPELGVVAAMSVSVPTPRFNQAVARWIREALAKAVAELESRLDDDRRGGLPFANGAARHSR
ncbi:MAG TPA: IclR family transcriptional regulator [Acidimicrobiales bacterium]|nr:IclR family transcriptional regulator [Acidimicrobiales bacterium]